MACFDVFNGDADGLCALHQLRLVHPREATLITGVKRDIALLHRVSAAANDDVTVLDISLDTNRAGLMRLLESGAQVLYFDHHFAGDIPNHPQLAAHIDTSPRVCTSLLVDAYLGGAHSAWAVAAAFGDGLADAARFAAQPLNLPAARIEQLRELGECLNYNAYGETEDDLYFAPAKLFSVMHRYADPFVFIEQEPAFKILSGGYTEDLDRAFTVRAEAVDDYSAVYILPDESWSRRVNGIFGNRLAAGAPHRAHAVLTPRSGGYVVSVRAPQVTQSGADEFCRRFATGGGRKSAAGINYLPVDELPRFVEQFNDFFARSASARQP
ncbi:MAG: acetyltransferase [Burkholderiales bacterium]